MGMEAESPSEKLVASMSKLIALSSGCETTSFPRASTVRKTPQYGLMSNLTWDENGELDIK